MKLKINFILKMSLKIKIHDENAIIPKKAGPLEIGFDLTAISLVKKLTDTTFMYETGISIEPPEGYYTEIVPRSSIVKTGYMLANSIGIIDPTYRGTLKIVLNKIDENSENLKCPFTKCQLILRPIPTIGIEVVDNLSDTYRGKGGFGSTDKYKIFFDGGCRQEKMGAGGVIYKENKEVGYISRFYDKDSKYNNTNNSGEYLSLINILELAKEMNIKNIEIYGDSNLVVKQIKGEFKVNKQHLKKLYYKALKLLEKFNYTINWIPREENSRADSLATLAIKSGKSLKKIN